MKKIVVALGGNALQSGKDATAEAQLNVVNKTSEHLAKLIAGGYELAIVHGNGPQVGRIVVASENAHTDETPAMPFDVCGAMSQGYIGYHIQQGMGRALAAAGKGNLKVASVVTQMVVDKNDKGFANPTKPVGAFKQQSEVAALEAKGYTMKEDSGRGYRRVVASPVPQRIVEIDMIKALIAAGHVVIACGGGGIPVVETANGLEGVAAVIDKDLSAELLAEEIGADALMILTEVEKVAINFGKPDQKDLANLTVEEARKYEAEGHFAPGSMLPKVQAAIKFAEKYPGKKAIISSLDKAIDALEGKTGTVITK